MDKEEHIKIHKELHKALDQLVADWIDHQKTGGSLRDTSIMELMDWSFEQTKNPTEGSR